MDLNQVFDNHAQTGIAVDYFQYFTDGQILGFETVTIGAGTFTNCLKWQYKIRVVQKMNGNIVSDQHISTFCIHNGITLYWPREEH